MRSTSTPSVIDLRLLDSSVLVARLSGDDANHAKAVGIEFPDAEINELVLAEVATVLHRKSGGTRVAAQAVCDVFRNVPMRLLDGHDMAAAMELYSSSFSKLSLTDCSLIVQAQRFDAELLTFDEELARAAKRILR